MGRKKKRDVRKMAKENLRNAQKRDGFFDGRFVERSEMHNKAYKRNDKHRGRNIDYDNED